MPGERIYEDLTLVRRRAKAAFWVFAGLTFLVLAYYWRVQILEHKKYLDLPVAALSVAHERRARHGALKINRYR